MDRQLPARRWPGRVLPVRPAHAKGHIPVHQPVAARRCALGEDEACHHQRARRAEARQLPHDAAWRRAEALAHGSVGARWTVV